MIWSTSWKNVWRNKGRSSIVILSIAFGLTAGIFSMAFLNGWIEQSVRKVIETDLSNIQVHNPKYLLNNETKYIIKNAPAVAKSISEIDNVKAVSIRINTMAMASSANSSEGVIVKGVNPNQEQKVTTLYKTIVAGDYFKTKLRNPAIIGESLAKKLKLKVKSKLIITTQSLTGELIYEAFRIVGIYKTDNSSFDKYNVFVVDKNLEKALDFNKNNATEIACVLNNFELTDKTSEKIKRMLQSSIEKEELTVRTWNEIQPAFEMMNEMTQNFSFIFLVIILFALSFGLINTMLMVVLERTRELGMLMAIGMSKGRIFLMILLETIFLSITGGAIGMALSFIVLLLTKSNGIDLSSMAEGMNAYGYTSIVYPSISASLYLLAAILVIIMATLASIFPARRALKLNPAEAVRHEA